MVGVEEGAADRAVLGYRTVLWSKVRLKTSVIVRAPALPVVVLHHLLE